MLSVPHHLRSAAFILCWLAALAPPTAAVMPTPSGSIPSEVAAAFDAHLFELPETAGRLGTSTAQTVWNIPVLLVGFSDQPFGTSIYGGSTPTQHFNRALFDTTGDTTTGSVFDYYRWVSGNRIRVIGRVVATLTLPNPKNFYANNNWGLGYTSPRNSYGFVVHALQAADSSVDWRPFDTNRDGYVDMLWVVHSGYPGEAVVVPNNLWSITSRLTSWPSGDSFETRTPLPGAPSVHMRIDRFSVLPELSSVHPGDPTEIGVYCHEFGHALGLPDLYDTSTLGGGSNVGPGNWSLMATGSYGTDGLSPEYPAHLGAWPLLWLGWRESIRPASDTLMVLAPLESGSPVVEFWFQGESNPEHFLIENRQRIGFDRNLPGEGLIVYQVDESVMALGVPSNRVNAGVTPGLRLVEADGLNDLIAGRNRGDNHDPFPGFFARTEFGDDTHPGTRSIRGLQTNIALREIEEVGDNMRFRMQVRAPGWGPATATTSGGFNPVWPSGAANRALSMGDGSVVLALSEMRAGRPQVILRSRSRLGPWDGVQQVSAGSASATDPSIGMIPGGTDLVVTWSDTRHGAGELYYRSRIAGVWSAERRLTDLPGDSRYPSVGVDRAGRVYLAWVYTEGNSTQLRFMTFTYFSPFGMSAAVTPPAAFPDAPVVAVDPSGRARIFWSDRATEPAPAVWMARYDPGTGVSPPVRLVGSSFSQPAIDAVVDASGTTHVVFQVSGPGVNQLRYLQFGFGSNTPNGTDSVVVSRGESIQNPAVRLDREQGLHITFVAANGGVPQVRYKGRHAGRGWDYGSTEVTTPAEGSTARPVVLPGLDREVSVLYFLTQGGEFHLMERRRNSPVGVVAVPAVEVRPGRPGLRMGPNPLRAGASLVLRLEGGPVEPGSVLEIYDLAGRRIVTAPLVRDADALTAEVPGDITRGWQSGVYFARVRGMGADGARLVVLR